MSALQAELNLAVRVARQAGAAILARWGGPVAIDHKGAVDLVSDADREAEAIAVAAIAAACPGDEIVAEEAAATDPLSGASRGGASRGGPPRGVARCWYIDPLDGTTNFVHGLPHFCTSIALVDALGPRIGVVHAPVYGWTFSAGRGLGATRDSAPVGVSATEALDEALLATGFPYDRRTNPDNNLHRFAHLLRRAQGMRRAGSAALDLAYVAAGWLDGYWEAGLKPWDIAAGLLLVTEAGGAVSALDGRAVVMHEGAVVATNGRLHHPLLAALGEAPSPEART